MGESKKINAWVAVDADGSEWVFEQEPFRVIEYYRWGFYRWSSGIQLPKGSIKALIGRELIWNDEPVELQEAKG